MSPVWSLLGEVGTGTGGVGETSPAGAFWMETAPGEEEGDSWPRGAEVAPVPVPSPGGVRARDSLGQVWGLRFPGGCGVWQDEDLALDPGKPPRAVASSPVADGSQRLSWNSHPAVPRPRE